MANTSVCSKGVNMKYKKKEDVLISILKFVYKNSELGVTYKDILNHPNVKSNPVALSYIESQFDQLGSRNAEGFVSKIQYLRPDALFMFIKDTYKIILSEKGYFNLIEYQELKEARTSSKWAQWTAIVAICISIAFGAIQICTS